MNKKTANTALYHPKYWLVWLAMALLQLIVLLPHSFLIHIGKFVGRLLLKFAGRRRLIAATNISLCFPELNAEEQQRLLVQTFEENCTGFIEAAASWLKPGKVAELNIVGSEILQKYQQDDKGLILLGAHYTALDICGRLFGRHYSYNIIYRPQNHPVINYLMERGRKEFLEAPAFNQHDFRKMVRCLKQGKILWFPADQDHGAKSSVFAPLFGIPAATIEMPTRLAHLTKANVLYASYYRLNDNSYEIKFSEMPGFGKDILADATQYNGMLEASLREHPAQYMWVHRRFKTRPEGEPGFYN